MIVLSKAASPVLLVREQRDTHAGQLERMFAEHSDFVWRMLRHLGIAAVDVEDAMQEVFVVVHKRLADYEERSSQRAWLYAICSRVSSKHRRSQLRRREATLAELPEVSIDPEQEHDIERQEALLLGRRLIDALPEKQRVVFLMYEVDHMPMNEVAAIIGCPIQTAYARLHKARERVRADLTRQQLLLSRGRS